MSLKKIINERLTFKGYMQDRTANDPDILLKKLRDKNLPVEHSFFATIHHASPERPDGYTEEDLEGIHNELEKHDIEKWKAVLDAHERGDNPESGYDDANDEGVEDYDDVGFAQEGNPGEHGGES